ncbi:MAG: MFS transporter [Sphingomonadales bacterium]|nr:MFS transporter [Sphingomonadales bacterium]
MTRAVAYGWIIFALNFGLLISDYMARQVLNAVFPLLKAEWTLSDTKLGVLSGIVAVLVGVLTFPLSLLADRWGRVRSLFVMATLWSAATLFCAAAASYEHMLIGRAMVGLGEAAYGSVGAAVVISVFPARMRATLSSAFQAGGLVGQILGVAVGAQIAADHGWRAAFAAIGLFGLCLALVYPLIVKERKIAALSGCAAHTKDAKPAIPSLRCLFSSNSLRLAYVGSGLQLFAAAALPAWLPSYFNRYYHLPVGQAGQLAAVFLATCASGLVLCGMVTDRAARNRPDRKIALAVSYSLITAVALAVAFHMPSGLGQLIVLGIAMFFVAGTSGPAGAMVANLTPVALHSSAFATWTLANNLLGLAPGPILTGRAADSMGLLGAFQLLPIPCVLAAAAFALARRSYLSDLEQRPT